MLGNFFTLQIPGLVIPVFDNILCKNSDSKNKLALKTSMKPGDSSINIK